MLGRSGDELTVKKSGQVLQRLKMIDVSQVSLFGNVMITAQALRDVAAQFGLSPDRADEALRHMLDGAMATLLHSGLTPAAVMDLIPVRPLQAIEESVTAAYGTALPALFAKIRPTA